MPCSYPYGIDEASCKPLVGRSMKTTLFVLALVLGFSRLARADDDDLALALAALVQQLQEQQADASREQRWDDTFQLLQSLQGIGRPANDIPASVTCTPFGDAVTCTRFP